MDTSRPVPSRRTRPFDWIFLAGCVLLLLVLDQLVKRLVVSSLAVGESWAPIPALAKVFTITHVQNTGIAFGQLHGLGWVFMVVNVVVLVGVLVFFRQIPSGAWSLRVASGLILAGDLGNVIDRLRTASRYWGAEGTFWSALSRASVTDMFDFKVWPVFNVADMCLVAGIITVGWVMWRTESQAQKAGVARALDAPEPAADDQGSP